MKETLFEIKDYTPIIAVAVHGGHQLRDDIKAIIGLSEKKLLHEEDPLTDYFAAAFNSKIIQNSSRFEYDVNRSPQSAVYKIPADCWDLPVYPNGIDESLADISQKKYVEFYEQIDEIIGSLLETYPKLFIWDIHSFNNRGRLDIHDMNEENGVPDICLGTSNSNPLFHPLFKEIAENIRSIDFFDKKLSVDFNNPFPGGYFARYLHHYYNEKVAVLSVELNKRIFMKNDSYHFDEADGIVDILALSRLKDILLSQTPIILNFYDNN